MVEKVRDSGESKATQVEAACLPNCYTITLCKWYCTVKNFGGKEVWQKGCCKGLVKKTLANVDLHHQSPTIN